jgi:hypothetical protein
MENWQNNSDEGKLKYSEEKVSRCHFVHLKRFTGTRASVVKVKE